MTTKQAQRKAAILFLQGKSVQFIARHIHMARSVVETWKSDVRFLDMLSEMETIQNERAEYQLRALKRQAVLVLTRALKSKNPKEYQWAVSKLFTLPLDLLTAPSLSRPGLLTSDAEPEEMFDVPAVRPQARPGTVPPPPQPTSVPQDRKSLMEFLQATRDMDHSKPPGPPTLN